MARNITLIALLPALFYGYGTASEPSHQVTWHATAIKYPQASFNLLHPGQQVIDATRTPHPAQELAAQLLEPDDGYQLLARALNNEANAPDVLLNGQVLGIRYQRLPLTDRYYLGYRQDGQPSAKQTTETGYDLIACWQS